MATVAALCILSLAEAQKYTIDASHSAVQIKVQRFGLVDVVGRFNEVSGSINYTKDDITATTAEAVIQVSSYDANNTAGEQAVKSPAFLDAATYPEITFQSTGLISKGGTQYIQGQLTIHGTTNAVEFPFTILGPLLDLPSQKQSIAASASLTINRQDYGIAFDRKLPTGGSLIGNEVTITLTILAIAE